MNWTAFTIDDFDAVADHPHHIFTWHRMLLELASRNWGKVTNGGILMDQENTLTLTADIVAAHVSNNSVAASDLPNLIQAVYGALSGLGEPEPAPEVELSPAVSIRASVKPETITCLECGQKLKMLKRHLGTDHCSRWHRRSQG